MRQVALWNLSQGEFSDAFGDPNVIPNTDKASKDLQDLCDSISTILSIIWSGLSSESSSHFRDFSSFTRLSLADVTEVIEGQAARSKSSSREVDEEVQSGSRDALGRDKERLEDTKVAFEYGMGG